MYTGDLGHKSGCGDEHDARDVARFYEETMRVEMLEFGDSSAVEQKLTRCELKLAERVAAIRTGDFVRVAPIDAHEDERRKWKAYHRSILKVRAKVSVASNSGQSSDSSLR